LSLTLTAAANSAAQFLGVLDSGESLSAQQLTDALTIANSMFDNWSSDGLFALADLVTPFALAAGVQGYTIGTGQVINMTRPVRIVAAAFTNTTGPGGQIEVIDEQKWAGIPDRQRRSWIIEKLFWDRANPTGTVYVSPVPLGALIAELHTFAPLTQFADVTTPITILPGYTRMIVLGLAIELAPQYQMAPPATLTALFADAAQRVRRLNASLLGEVPPEAAQAAQ
jgi:hypothetical protein